MHGSINWYPWNYVNGLLLYMPQIKKLNCVIFLHSFSYMFVDAKPWFCSWWSFAKKTAPVSSMPLLPTRKCGARNGPNVSMYAISHLLQLLQCVFCICLLRWTVVLLTSAIAIGLIVLAYTKHPLNFIWPLTSSSLKLLCTYLLLTTKFPLPSVVI